MVRVLLLVVAFTACGRVSFDPLGGDDAAIAEDDAAIGGDASADAPMITCPGTYGMLPGFTSTSRYRVVNTAVTWDAAEAACEAEGAHLAILGDSDELGGVYAALLGQTIWIGVTDRITEATYRTVTGGTPMFLVWDIGQPAALDCLYIDGVTSLLHTQACTTTRQYVCECDGTLADPASY